MSETRVRVRELISSAGEPTPAAIQQFTEGDCWLLAFELGRELSAPLVALVEVGAPHCWDHVLVDLGRERLLDVFGVHTREETLAYWNGKPGEALTLRELGRFHTLTGLLLALDGVEDTTGLYVSHDDERDARHVAQALADRYRSAPVSAL